MAELRFGGRDDAALPLYLNPNIYLQNAVSDPSPALPVVNRPIFILCSVQNTGDRPVAGAIVQFYICNPATIPTRSTSQLLGQSFVDLDARETKEVLCLSPWTPILYGHFCIICEISASEDPSPFTSNGPWDIHDRHVAQHNVDVVEPSEFVKRPHLATFVVAGLANEPYATVIVRRASIKEFTSTVKLFDGSSLIKRNVTAESKAGFVEKFSPGDPVPNIESLQKKIVLKDLKPNEQRTLRLAVRLPDDISQLSAAAMYVEQIDTKQSVVGGQAIVALSGPIKMKILSEARPTVAPAAVPVSIPLRPYSTFPQSNFMTPDGIFCSNFGTQNINVQIRNDGTSSLRDLSAYIEAVADPNIALTYGRSHPQDGPVRANASFKSIFQGDFSRAASKETLVSFIVQQQSGVSSKSVRIVKKIFVLGIDFNKATKTFAVKTPQGLLQVIIKTVVVPKKLPGGVDKIVTYPIFIKDATMNWIPVPAYGGIHGPLPFEDPWWKVILCIIAIALAIAGAIEAANAGGEASIGKSGQFAEPDDTESCCDGTEVHASTDSYVAAGLFGSAAGFATAAQLSDDADLIDRGRVHTIPSRSEMTISERATFESDFANAPSPGTPFNGKTKWSYERKLNSGRMLTHSATDTYQNIHFLSSYRVSIDSTQVTDPSHRIAHARSEPLLIEATFQKPSGELFRGPGLYVFAHLWSDHQESLFIELRDDGSEPEDINPNIGVYRAKIMMQKEGSRTWFVFVYAQDVNTVMEGTPPREAAKTIGGALLTRQFVVGLDTKPCELNYDATVLLT
ncbi:hypothetical protein FOBRF1_013727 [Fusarium oxysporum]